MRNTVAIIVIVIGIMISGSRVQAGEGARWEDTSRVRGRKTHVVPALWANLPRLNAKAKVNILDVDGPGVVTLIHASAVGTDFVRGFDSEETQSVILRVFYDGETAPSIEMPYMDFFADVQCKSAYFDTIYFTKVKESHNFRLPMPFRKHIRIELENPSDKNLVGYADVQWEEVSRIPDDCGYLKTDYRTGNLNPKKANVIFELNKPGTIVAHWLQYESEKSPRGEVICEADQEIYLDGDEKPTLNYLGTEDAYGHSWGFQGTDSGSFAAIIKREDLKPAGARIAVLRCRDNDAISFTKSCKWILTFLTDPWTLERLGDTTVPYRHCVYYYTKK